MRKSSGVYVMRVASMLCGMHPQTLRKYERAGLLEPARSNTLRLYSEEDIARLKLIKHLVEDLGLNLAGVEMALHLRNCVFRLQRELSEVRVSKEQEQRLSGILDDMLRVLDAA